MELPPPPQPPTPPLTEPAKLGSRLQIISGMDIGELRRLKEQDDRWYTGRVAAVNALRRETREGRRKRPERGQLRAAQPAWLTFGLHFPDDQRDAFISAVIQFDGSAQDLASLGVRVRTGAANIFTAEVPLHLIPKLQTSQAVEYIELARPYMPQLLHAIPRAGINEIHRGGTTGAGVIVGVIDTGLDFYHPHFLKTDGTSRLLYLWDQTLDQKPGESGPPATLPGFFFSLRPTYGVEYSQGQINEELRADAPHYGIVRSTPEEPVSHGTLVASCAAGSGHVENKKRIYVGAAPGAELIYVVTSRNDATDSTNVLDAFAYIFARASELGKPCVVNLSDSETMGPHDGSSLGEQFLDKLLLSPGRAITCSAGNVNTTSLYTRGRVVQGRTTRRKLKCAVLFGGDTVRGVTVPIARGAVVDEKIQVWYDGNDRFTASLEIPSTSSTTIAGVRLGSVGHVRLPEGIDVWLVSKRDPRSGNNLIELLTSGASTEHPLPLGTWTLSLEGTCVVSGAFQAWISRNNEGSVAWTAPVPNESTVGCPATGRRVISVGAHDSNEGTRKKGGRTIPAIMALSGRGPTRDGRMKPEIVGPGEVKAALSRNRNAPTDPRAAIDLINDGGDQGTSFSSAIVAGAAALFFESRGGKLASGDIKQLLTASAMPPDSETVSNAFGFGVLSMKRAGATQVPGVDVWVRDSPMDTGIEPYVGNVLWRSPDIVLLDAAGKPTANPVHDPTNLWNNLVDVTIRNRGSRTARNTTVYLYWADPSTNIPFPREWKSSGIYSSETAFARQANKAVVPELGPGASVTVRFSWAPPAPGSSLCADDHFSLIARVEHESDPSHLTAGGWPVVQGSNNVAVRGVHVQGLASGDPTTAFFVAGSGDDEALEVSCEDLFGSVELVVPTRALPWRELALLERCHGKRPYYGCPSGYDPTEEVQRILEQEEVIRILGITGVERAHVNEVTTRLVGQRDAASLICPEIRIQHGVKMPVRLWVRRPRLKNQIGWVNIGQRSGGKLIGGLSLELRRHLVPPKRYKVRLRGSKIDVKHARGRPNV